MKSKSLLALALAIATIGLSFPAVAGDRDGNNNRQSDRKERRYNNYDKYYHYYELKGGDYIYIGRNGDYYDSKGNYHEASDNPSYRKYYNSRYNYKRYGKYYYDKKYYADYTEQS